MTAEERQAAKDTEQFAKQRGEAFRKVGAELLGFLAIFTAGRGVKEFVASITTGDAATGRLARSLDMSVQSLSTWEAMAERTGGSAAGMAGSFQGLMGDLQNFALTGQSSTIPYFRALGISVADASGKVRPLEDILLDVNKAVQGMDPARATAMLQGLHLDPSAIGILMQTPDALRKLREEVTKSAAISDADAKAAIKRQTAFVGLRQESEKMGRTILTSATPAILKVIELLERLSAWVQAHSTEITLVFEKVANALGRVDWDGVGSQVLAVATEINGVVTALGGWVSVSEALFALWAGSKFLGMLRGIGLLKTAITGISAGGAATGGGILGFLLKHFGVIGPAIGALTGDGSVAQPGDLEKQLPALQRQNERLNGTDASPSFFNGGVGRWLQQTFGGGHRSLDASGMPAPAAFTSGGSQDTGDANQTAQNAAAHPEITRGIRNNNPGNLNFAGQDGAVKEQQPGGRFAVFGSMAQGIAALGHQLMLYQSRGIDTVQGIISKYAPGFENDTGGYIGSVVKSAGLTAGQHLDLKDPEMMRSLIKAITTVEVGRGKITDAQINQALQLSPSNAQRYASAEPPRAANNNHTETHINGPITVHTKATDAKGIANDMHFALRGSFAGQANTGLA